MRYSIISVLSYYFLLKRPERFLLYSKVSDVTLNYLQTDYVDALRAAKDFTNRMSKSLGVSLYLFSSL